MPLLMPDIIRIFLFIYLIVLAKMEVDKLTKNHVVKSYECDRESTLRIPTLMNMFQDIAYDHANKIGVGFDFCQSHGMTWVSVGFHIIIDRMPRTGETIKVVSWPSETKSVVAIREFLVVDNNNSPIIKASSQWAVLDLERKRPVLLRDRLISYPVIPERALDAKFAKLPLLDRIDITSKFIVRYDDIDVNNHVNNSIYPLWASENVDRDFRLSHIPTQIEISFIKEGHFKDNIRVSGKIEGTTSYHSIQTDNRSGELARVKIIWSRLPLFC